MKKSLSLLVAATMVLGSLASVASAADDSLTTAQKYQQFLDSKVLKGNPDGQAHLADNLTRAEFATVITAIAGLKEDTSTSAFKDVTLGQWWQGAIQAAYNAGLVNGVGADLFSPKANVTVQEIIVVAARLAKLTPVADAKIDGAADWAAPYIQAAIDANLAVPTNYTSPATRGQTIDVAYAVTQALAVPALSDVAAVANGDDTITVTGKVSDKADSVKVTLGTNEAVDATLNADKTFTYTTAKQANGTYNLTVVAYEGTKASAKVEKSVTISAFAVDSATVLNAKQIAVKFNKSVQKGVNSGGANYKNDDGDFYFNLNGSLQPHKVDVSDDGKTATLTFAYEDGIDALQGTTALLNISGDLNSASGQDLPAYSAAIAIKDDTAPSVSDVTFKGTVATVVFSEALLNEGNVSIGGTAIDAVEDSDHVTVDGDPQYVINKDDEGDIASISIYNLSKDTSYDLDIVGFMDLNENDSDYSKTIKVPNDTEKPTVSSVTVNGAIVSVKFSEDVKVLADGNHAVYNIDGTDDDTVEASYDSDSNTVKLNLHDYLSGSSFRNVTLKVTGQTDYASNEQTSAYSKSVKIVDDTTAPTFSSATIDGNKIIAKFNEDLNNTNDNSATDTVENDIDLGALSYKYVDSDGVQHSGTTTDYTAVVGYDLNNDGSLTGTNEQQYVVITVNDEAVVSSSKFKAGKHTFTIKSATATDLQDVSANSIDSDVVINFTATTGTTSGALHLESALQLNTSDNVDTIDTLLAAINLSYYTNEYYTSTNNNRLVFVFNKDLTASQLKTSNFLINGAALPEGTSLFFDGSKKVVVADLPSGAIKTNGTRTLKVVNLVDADGNSLNTDTASYYQAKPVLTENVAPTAKSVEFVSDNVVKVTFSEKIAASSSDVAGITVTINGTKYSSGNDSSTKLDVSVGSLDSGAQADSTVVYIFGASAGDFNTDKKFEVKFDGAALTDMNGNAVAAGTVSIN